MHLCTMGTMRFRIPGRQPKPVVDPCMGDPGAFRLRDAISRRDWRSVRDFLGAVDDPDDRAFYLEICSRIEGVQDWIGEWIAAEPGSTLPLLVKGAHGVEWAWAARGAAYAGETSAQQFREFHRRLKMAEDCLDEVVERDPEDTAAWSFLVTSARGRGVGPEEAWRRFDAVVSRHPLHIRAHSQMLQGLCAKWFGSDEQMFAFARKAVAASPPGSPLGQLIAVAHFEHWLDEREDGYLSRPEVLAELHAAARHSVLNPAHRRRPGWPVAHNVFACVFVGAKDYTAAKEQFEVIGDLVTMWPWQVYDDPAGMFQTWRKLTRKHG